VTAGSWETDRANCLYYSLRQQWGNRRWYRAMRRAGSARTHATVLAFLFRQFDRASLDAIMPLMSLFPVAVHARVILIEPTCAGGIRGSFATRSIPRSYAMRRSARSPLGDRQRWMDAELVAYRASIPSSAAVDKYYRLLSTNVLSCYRPNGITLRCRTCHRAGAANKRNVDAIVALSPKSFNAE